MIRRPLLLLMMLAVAVPATAAGPDPPDPGANDPRDPFGAVASLRLASPTVVKTKAILWLTAQGVKDEKLAAAKAAWKEVEPSALLDRLAGTLAIGDRHVAELVGFCTNAGPDAKLPDVAWLSKKDLDPFVRDNLRLYFGRWLARNKYYDEALAQFADLDAATVVDPASLLFFQSVCYHSLVQPDPGLKAIGRLLEDVDEAPTRYVRVAALMLQDLKGVKGESLDFASRLMRDAERRLRLARAGKRVRKVEDDVVSILDKLIKEMEEAGGG